MFWQVLVFLHITSGVLSLQCNVFSLLLVNFAMETVRSVLATTLFVLFARILSLSGSFAFTKISWVIAIRQVRNILGCLGNFAWF